MQISTATFWRCCRPLARPVHRVSGCEFRIFFKPDGLHKALALVKKANEQQNLSGLNSTDNATYCHITLCALRLKDYKKANGSTGFIFSFKVNMKLRSQPILLP